MLSIFFSSKCSLFHNATFFGACIIYILYTGCAEIKKNNSGAKGLTPKQIYACCKLCTAACFDESLVWVP